MTLRRYAELHAYQTKADRPEGRRRLPGLRQPPPARRAAARRAAQPRRARPPCEPAVAERMQRLEEAGVITGYHVAIDPRALGYALGAVIRVRPGPGQLPRIA